jgi:hypothetical protein
MQHAVLLAMLALDLRKIKHWNGIAHVERSRVSVGMLLWIG